MNVYVLSKIFKETAVAIVEQYIADNVASYYDGNDTDEIPSLGFRLKCLCLLIT